MKSPRVPILISLPYDAERVQIYIASDIHNGSAEFSEKKWKAFEDLLSQPDTYVIFVGDQMEYATRQSKSDVYTQKLSPRQQKDWWIEHLPLYDIALALGIKDRYRSEAAFVDIGVGRVGRAGKQVHYVLRVQHQAKNNANHGTADGFEGIDVFVSGHTHKPMDKPLGKLIYDTSNKAVYEKTVENVVGGHFLEYGGYGERAGYRPTSQKLYSIILSGKKKAIETRGFHL